MPLPEVTLEFFNGLGGFAENGREYVTVLGEGLRTPEPWVNVIANPDFGFLVSESGSGFTWSLNSHENQLTPWSNDHVMDTPGEAIYVRDEVTGEVWTPTALPIRDEKAAYMARHGQGYSRFQHGSHGILLDLVQFVAPDDPIKISRLTLQNNSAAPRRLSVTAYVEWVLGSSRSASAPYIITEIDPQSGAIFARNAWNGEFGGRISLRGPWPGSKLPIPATAPNFWAATARPNIPRPWKQGHLFPERWGPGLILARHCKPLIELRPGAAREIVFFLGQTENRGQARELLDRYRAADLDQVLREVTAALG